MLLLVEQLLGFSNHLFGDWKATVAAATGLAAKEAVVGTFGVLYNDSTTSGLYHALQLDYTSLAAYSFLTFICSVRHVLPQWCYQT